MTCDPAGGDPFGNEDVALVVKAGVVRVDKLAINPGLGVAAINLLFLSHPFDIITQPGDDLVLFIEQGHARVQLGHEHQILVGVDIGGQAIAAKGCEMLPFKA